MSHTMFRTLSAVTVAALLLTLAPVHANAQTPDGVTPPNEGVCDGLRADGVTKGLYGLCVAFCEAQDCVPNDDGSLPQSCVASDKRILDNYNKRKLPSDPDMPCVQQPCRCWTQEELGAALSSWGQPFNCDLDRDQGTYEDTQVNWVNELGRLHFYVDSTGSGDTPFTCQYYIQDAQDPTNDVSRFFDTTVEEDAVCRDQLETLIQAELEAYGSNGFHCQ